MKTGPVLLFNNECSVCRWIAAWVSKSVASVPEPDRIVVRAIGDDPLALRALHPGLSIWDAYETIHLVYPDGAMKVGGEAVAEVLRGMPHLRRLSRAFNVTLFGVRPFQSLLNLAYVILSDVRPVLGCESCGEPSVWMRPIAWIRRFVTTAFAAPRTRVRPMKHASPVRRS